MNLFVKNFVLTVFLMVVRISGLPKFDKTELKNASSYRLYGETVPDKEDAVLELEENYVASNSAVVLDNQQVMEDDQMNKTLTTKTDVPSNQSVNCSNQNVKYGKQRRSLSGRQFSVSQEQSSPTNQNKSLNAENGAIMKSDSPPEKNNSSVKSSYEEKSTWKDGVLVEKTIEHEQKVDTKPSIKEKISQNSSQTESLALQELNLPPQELERPKMINRPKVPPHIPSGEPELPKKSMDSYKKTENSNHSSNKSNFPPKLPESVELLKAILALPSPESKRPTMVNRPRVPPHIPTSEPELPEESMTSFKKSENLKQSSNESNVSSHVLNDTPESPELPVVSPGNVSSLKQLPNEQSVSLDDVAEVQKRFEASPDSADITISPEQFKKMLSGVTEKSEVLNDENTENDQTLVEGEESLSSKDLNMKKQKNLRPNARMSVDNMMNKPSMTNLRVPSNSSECPYFQNISMLLPQYWPQMNIFELMNELYERVLEDCGEVDIQDLMVNVSPEVKERVEHREAIIVFEGTNWCGPGNTAKDFDDLGIYKETDECCREHDSCSDVLYSGAMAHGLINHTPWTLMNCSCNEKLWKCLRQVNSLVSNIIGFIFFTLVHDKCFSFNYPIVGCKLYDWGQFRFFCKNYTMDTEEPMMWQWFDESEWVFGKNVTGLS